MPTNLYSDIWTNHDPRLSKPAMIQVQDKRTVIIAQSNSKGRLEQIVPEIKDIPKGLNQSYRVIKTKSNEYLQMPA